MFANPISLHSRLKSQTHQLRVLGMLSLAALVPGCADIDSPLDKTAGTAGEEKMTRVEQSVTVPSGFGNYCSMSWSSGGWGLKLNTSDPCGEMSASSPGGTPVRAGLYSLSGRNTVMVRCVSSSGGVGLGLYTGNGSAPFLEAYNGAGSQTNCVFTAAPANFPIFDAPFSLSASGLSHTLGFDFAEGFSTNVADYGQTGSTAATVVDHLGREHTALCGSGKCGDNHAAHDWPMNPGADIKAVADGTVIMYRSRPVVDCATPTQNELWIRHTVGTGLYAEYFVTYYAHFDSFNSALLPPAQQGQAVSIPVTRGQVLGKVGATGCASGTHLHMGVTRLTNTTDSLVENFQILPGENNSSPDTSDSAIDPYGWSAPQGVDPWGYKGYPHGAFSSNLWNPGQTPPNNW